MRRRSHEFGRPRHVGAALRNDGGSEGPAVVEQRCLRTLGLPDGQLIVDAVFVHVLEDSARRARFRGLARVIHDGRLDAAALLRQLSARDASISLS